MKTQPLWKAYIHGHKVIYSARMEKSKGFPWAKCGLSSCWCAQLSYPGAGKGKTFKEAAVTQLLPRVERQWSISAPHFEGDINLVTRFTAKKQRTGENIDFTVEKASQCPLYQGKKASIPRHAPHDSTWQTALLLPPSSHSEPHPIAYTPLSIGGKTPWCVSNISANKGSCSMNTEHS